MTMGIFNARIFQGSVLFLVLAGLWGCKGREAKAPEAEPEKKASEERTVSLTPEQIRDQGIVFGSAGPAPLDISISLPGEVTLNADKTARLTPRFAGVAKAIYKNLGDKVGKGDLLAVIESNESLSPYELRSPMAGTVVEKNITLGQLLKEEDPAFVVADLSSVWLLLGIFPEDLGRIKVGQLVTVRSAEGDLTAQAMVSFIDAVADKDTRTLYARVVLPNRDGAWKPGLFGEAHITVGHSQATVTVPNEAVQVLGGKPAVFRKTDQGAEAVFPILGLSDGKRTEIREGVVSGDSIVVGNAFLIKSELEKSSFAEEGEEEGESEK